jgi:DNA-binding Lrp family transcriptional regulator
MAKSNLKKLIGKNAHWTINKSLAREIGLIETLILQHIIDLQSVWSVTEVFQSYGDMAEELGITEHAIKNAIPKLQKIGLISVERKSVGYRNFYKVNEEAVYLLIENPKYSQEDTPHLTSEVNTPHWSVEGASEVKTNSQWVENYTTSEVDSTLSEVESGSLRGEKWLTITNNNTNNKLQKINKKNTTTSSSGSNKKIAEKILDTLTDYDSNIIKYNNAIEDFNELGGIDGISELLEWDATIKNNWNRKIQNVYAIK